MDTPKLSFQAGDLVILRTNEWIKKEQADKIKETYKAQFPDARDVVILPGDMQIEFVSAPQKPKPPVETVTVKLDLDTQEFFKKLVEARNEIYASVFGPIK